MKPKFYSLILFFLLILIINSSCEKQFDYSADVIKLKKDVLELQKRTDSLTLVLNQLNNNNNSRIDSLKNQINSIVVQITQINVQITQINSSSSNINDLIAELNKQLALLTSQLNYLYSQFNISPSSLNDGLVAYYPFNGNARDESGNNNNGVINGATLTTDRFGIANKAFSFDGINDNIVIANSNSLNPSEISICAWINSYGINSQILQKSDPTNATQLSYRITYEDEFQGFKGLHSSWGTGKCSGQEQGGFWSPRGIIPQNIWSFITVTITSSGQLKQYYNGKEIGSSTKGPFIPCNNSKATLRIGGLHWQNDPEWFSGKIDEVRIYNRILSDAEISFLSKL